MQLVEQEASVDLEALVAGETAALTAVLVVAALASSLIKSTDKTKQMP